jgi:hypothetical protein
MTKRNRTKGQATSTKQYHKTKDWVARTPLKTGCELRCSGRVNSYCSTNGTRRVNIDINPVISQMLINYNIYIYNNIVGIFVYLLSTAETEVDVIIRKLS